MDAALVALVACAAPPAAQLHNRAPAQPDADRCDVPWDPSDLARGEVHVLAWKIDANDDVHIDSAIILVVRRGRFELAHVVRHRGERISTWQQALIVDAPGFLGGEVLSAPPTRQQFDAFLVATRWLFGPNPEYALSAKGICAREWRTYLGGEPWHHFGEIGELRSTSSPAP